jgi:YfiH family protein
VQANQALMVHTLGIRSEQLVTAHQVHGAHVALVGTSQRGTVIPATDSLISQGPGVALLLRFADCLPLMLYDPPRQAIGLVHAGWRGCLGGVVPNTLVAMQRAFASDPRDLTAGLGPAIGPCCYQVGPDLIKSVRHARGSLESFLLTQPDGSVHFDLPSAVRSQLCQAGVRRIEDSALCTCCHTDEFFSHRGERGRTGRFAAVLSLRE